MKSHEEIERIEEEAFDGCWYLRWLKSPGVKIVEEWAFNNCQDLTDVEFGEKLETIGDGAFNNCISMRNIKMPSVRTIVNGAFLDCWQLTDVELLEVETIDDGAFRVCKRLTHIAIPLKDNMFLPNIHTQQYTQFNSCENLTTVDLVGGIHKTISSLLLESWRNDMNQEIDRINQDLPNTPADEKTDAIRLWIRSVLNRMVHCKTEHYASLKEGMTQLELALWKANLDDTECDTTEREQLRDSKSMAL